MRPVAHPPGRRRAGFTLVELLVVMSIMLIVLVMTASVLNVSFNKDVGQSTAQRIQAYLEGAKSRALSAKEPRGVRFFVDVETDPTTGVILSTTRTVKSMVYIQPLPDWTQGSVEFERADLYSSASWTGTYPPSPVGTLNPDNTPDMSQDADTTNDNLIHVIAQATHPTDATKSFNPTNWAFLVEKGVLANGCKISFPSESGRSYSVDVSLIKRDIAAGVHNNAGYRPKLILDTAYYKLADTAVTERTAFQARKVLNYRLQLLPAPLPGETVVQFPNNGIINLDRSSTNPVPANNRAWGNTLAPAWRKTSTAAPYVYYANYLDVMFTPTGQVMGDAAARGQIQFYVGDDRDRVKDQTAWTAGSASTDEMTVAGSEERHPGLWLTIFTRTGAVTTSPLVAGQNFADGSVDRTYASEMGGQK